MEWKNIYLIKKEREENKYERDDSKRKHRNMENRNSNSHDYIRS